MSNAPRFELLFKLGEGGMGEVWLARMHLALRSEVVALKRIRPELARQPRVLRDFEREARLTSLLHHPNVVALRRYGQDAQGPYLALEFVAGRSAHEVLEHLAKQGKRMPLSAALGIARDAARGLAWAHAFRDDALQVSQVLHRDVSPDNLLVSYEGLTRVADFGLARAVGNAQAGGAGGKRGKHGFIAPEVYLGREADVRSDVFAFAATLFELLTSRPAFAGSTDEEVHRAVQEDVPVRAASLADVPDALDFWIERALSKDPLDRPVNLAEVLAHLERLLQGEPREGREAVAALMFGCFPPGKDARRALITQAAQGEEATVLKLTALPVHDPPAPPPPARRWRLWAAAGVLGLVGLGAAAALALRALLASAGAP